MPIYRYQASGEKACDYCRNGFEKLQRLRDAPLEACPGCLSPVVKVITGVNVAVSGASLDKDNLEEHGFTQYRRVEKGVYERSAGKGPKVIGDDDS
jgi:putative FmdB family regulatory protein